MRQLKIPAAFVRGGTSNGIAFLKENLPPDRDDWKEIFLAAMGSPDPNRRQLNGMGGGISSLSKIMIVEKSKTDGVDIDYTFCQVAPKDDWVAYTNICGNMASAVGPFAVDEGLVKPEGDEVCLRVRSTNTGVQFDTKFAIYDGKAAVEGDFKLPGVSGTGSPVRNEFLDPGGANTASLLPSGNIIDQLELLNGKKVDASLVDATLAVAYVAAEAIGITGKELPAQVDDDPHLMEQLEHLRCQAGILMGLGDSLDYIRDESAVVPKICFVTPPQDSPSLSGEILKADDCDFTARMMSSGNCHRALPSTGSACIAVAARIEGSTVHRVARTTNDPASDVRVMHPSGILSVTADVEKTSTGWYCNSVGVYRTQRRLFDGFVYVPASKVPSLVTARAKMSKAAN
ncbi:MAG: 2-methylaconitate cis-trans isomerase PrpF family protein [Alphaproteobacteria bacterium]